MFEYTKKSQACAKMGNFYRMIYVCNFFNSPRIIKEIYFC